MSAATTGHEASRVADLSASRPRDPNLLDALSLLAEVGDQLLVGTVRDTHLAWADRVHGLVRRPLGGAPTVPEMAHKGIAGAVYGGLGVALRGASRGLHALGCAEVGPPLEETARGRFLSSAVNGLIGDRLVEERPHLAIPMAVRLDGRDVEPERERLAEAFPDAGDRVVVFMHGLCENESYWRIGRDERGPTYAEELAGRGWTPLMLRGNTGLGIRANGVALSALMQRLHEQWPVPLRRIAMVGHSMGGLIIRAAGAVASDVADHWRHRVTDVVTLGTPHLGAPIARGIGHGSRGLGRLPETAPFGRILDWRSAGVHDLVAGLAEDVPPLPHARYRLVAATLTESHRHPVGHLVGDMLVRVQSAYGRDRHGAELFPGAEVLHVGRADHFDLLNHPRIHQALRTWLS